MISPPSALRRQVATMMLFIAAAYVVLVATGALRLVPCFPVKSASISVVDDAALSSGRDGVGYPADATLVASTDEIEAEEWMPCLIDSEAPVLPPRPVNCPILAGEQAYIPDLATFRDNSDLTYG